VPEATLLSRTAVDVQTEFASWLDDFPLLGAVVIERLVYLSDGLEVHAYLVAPVGAASAPSVLYARGGGATHSVRPFILGSLLAPLANAGFCVLATQLRAEPQGRDEFGGAEIADLVNAAALLGELPEADPTRVGLIGWSRGSMMVLMALAHAPSRFRAAICVAGVADQFAEVERRPEMGSVFAREVPGYLEDRDTALARRSPLLWASQLPRDVPILLLHGSADWRVSALEPLKLATAFQELLIPYRLLVYEGAGHGLREFRDESTAEMIAWFQRYLEEDAPPPNVTPHGR